VSTGIPCCKNFTITINGTLPDCTPVTPDMFGWYEAPPPTYLIPGALLTTGLVFPYTLIPPPDINAEQTILLIGPFVDNYVCNPEKKCPYTVTLNFKGDGVPPDWGASDPLGNSVLSGTPYPTSSGQIFKVLLAAQPALDIHGNPIPYGAEMNITASVVSNPP